MKTTLPHFFSRSLSALVVCAAASAASGTAHAQEFRLHAETAVALWLDAPQSDRFTPGFYGALRPGLSLGKYVDLQFSYALLHTPAASGFTDDGTAHFFLGGLRLRPFAGMQPPEEQLGGFFVDFNAGYVRTGGLDRFGFDAGIGYGFQMTPGFSLGVVARYTQVVQPNDVLGQEDNDGHLMTFGLDFGFGPAYTPPEVQVVAADCPACVQETCPVLERCPDGDGDGVCDIADRCPNELGTVATLGCPTLDPCTGAPITVHVQFEYNSDAMPASGPGRPRTMDPILDAVAAAVAQDPTCRVCIVGYASEEGAADTNLFLSQQRATAVQGYMNHRGVALNRMPTTGLGDRCQMEPEQSLERNRRVEFRRLQDGESCPTTCATKR